MSLKTDLITKYQTIVAETEKQLIAKRFSIGEADSGKESRFPTGRVELEDQIDQLQNKFHESKKILKTLLELPEKPDISKVSNGVQVTLDIDGESKDFLITEHVGDFFNGILSLDSPLGKLLVGQHSGDVVTSQTSDTNFSVKITSIR